MINALTSQQNRREVARESSELRRDIYHNTEQIALQSLALVLFFGSGLYCARRNSIVVPLLMVPALKQTTSKLTRAICERRAQVQRLKSLARE